jgi:hypothetical protein
MGHSHEASVRRARNLTFYSQDAPTLVHGLRIRPAFLESRRRSQPGGGFFMPLSMDYGRK